MYRVVVKGEVGPAILRTIDRFEVESTGAQSVLIGRDADQADLYGLLVQLQQLGIELVSVMRANRQS